MSKKNSSVNLKKCIEDHSESTFTYLNFKSNLKSYNQKSYVVAVSGGPDSLALACGAAEICIEKKSNIEEDLNLPKNVKNKNSESEGLNLIA